MSRKIPAKLICIHGHFYQPPRENAWTEILGRQPSARPHHDWNERITSQCYRPNARARILGESDRIIDIVNNYGSMSFNVGPTLLSWLEAREPSVYQAILEADRLSCARFSGHGSAMAQVYGHVILPLATPRDRRTQVLWGIRDFEHRFGRAPEGMWLAETAVDIASLEALANAGIAFTVLSPRQAKRIGAAGSSGLVDVTESSLDTQRAYRVDLPSGRAISVFFYDGGLSQAVAFERLLSDGGGFARRLLGAFRPGENDEPRLVHIATDGETYGHHHPFGEMALAWATRAIEASGEAALTNYSEFLSLAPPTHVAEIIERSSWSCAHGVGRWSTDCGCRMRAGSSQAWRGPLRAALDGLRSRIDAFFERSANDVFTDPWVARDAYIDVVLDRSTDSTMRFLNAHGRGRITGANQQRALELMELERFAMLMFTSCGWFFDDVDGLETTQILEYAGRAIDLATRLGAEGVVSDFEDALAAARPITGAVSAREVFQRRMTAARVDSERVAAHVAVAALVGSPDVFDSSAHAVEVEQLSTSGPPGLRPLLATGRIVVRHRFTSSAEASSFAMLHEEDLVFEGVTTRGDATLPLERLHALSRAGERQALRALLESIDGGRVTSIGDLLPDAQGRVLTALLERTMTRVGSVLRDVHRECAPLLRLIAPLAVDPPKALVAASKLVLQAEIVTRMDADPPDFVGALGIVETAREGDVHLDLPDLEHHLRGLVDRLAVRVETDGSDSALAELGQVVDFALSLFRSFDLSRAQDLVWRLASSRGEAPPSPILATLADRLHLTLPRAAPVRR